MNKIDISGLDSMIKTVGANSLRIYPYRPNFEHLTDSVWAVFYPNDTMVMDIMELVPNIVEWTETSSLSMGNWTSLAEIKNEHSKLNIKKTLILKSKLQLHEIN